MNGKKRAAAAWALLVLLIPCMITGAAASEPESYIFERMPDIAYLDDVSGFFPVNSGAALFAYDGLLPEGKYMMTFVSAVEGMTIDVPEPVSVVYGPGVGDWSGEDAVFSGTVNLITVYGDESGVVPCDIYIYQSDGQTGLLMSVEGSLLGSDAVSSVRFDSVLGSDVDSAASMSPILNASNTTLPSVITSLYDMIRTNELLAFFAFCGVLTAAVAVYLHLKQASHK